MFQPTQGIEKFFPDDNPVQAALDQQSAYFLDSSGNKNVQVHYVWGVKDLNTTGRDKYMPGSYGNPIFFKSLNLMSKESQVALLEICEDLKQA